MKQTAAMQVSQQALYYVHCGLCAHSAHLFTELQYGTLQGLWESEDGVAEAATMHLQTQKLGTDDTVWPWYVTSTESFLYQVNSTVHSSM